MFDFFSHIQNVIRFNQLPKEKRRLTFYSEGKNYWPDLKDMIKEVLNTSDIIVSYVSSDANDPGLSFSHPNYQTFKINEGFVRNWFFENLQTDIMVMTMPDIHQYQVKRSKYNVHYIYTQHALGSLHMTYRKGAFDYYDTIFCAGPHHIKEIRAMEALYNLPPKNLVEHGYARLDTIIQESKKFPKQTKKDGELEHVLFAPTWGEHGTIESGIAIKIIDKLLENGYKVTLRPHPQTIKLSKSKVDLIVNKYSSNKLFNYEANISGQKSLHQSDVLISDWSGVALDYAFGLNKPVWFVDVPRKVNNKDYQELNIEPFEVSMREKIGHIYNDNFQITKPKIQAQSVYNIGKSAQVAAKYLISLLKEQNV